MDTATQTLHLLDLLYSGADDRAAFHEFTATLSNILGGGSVALSLALDIDRPTEPTSVCGFDPKLLAQYGGYYHAKNVHYSRSVHLLAPGALISSEETCPDRILETSEYYNDFLKPQGLYHAFAAVVHVNSQQTSMVTLYRGRHSGPFGEQEKLLFRALVPHLQRVENIANQKVRDEAGLQALNRIRLAVAIVSPDGKMLRLNAAAEALIVRADGLTITNRTLRASRREDDAKLKAAIQSACRVNSSEDGTQTRVRWLPVYKQSGGRPYRVGIEPFFGRASDPGRCAAILYIFDPDVLPESESSGLDSDSLRVLFGLTPAELRLAILLIRGMDLTKASERLSVSRNTVRTQLRGIFDKTGVRRQSELVGLMARLALHPFG